MGNRTNRSKRCRRCTKYSYLAISISSYLSLPIPRSTAHLMVYSPFLERTLSIKCSFPLSFDCKTRSIHARSMATGSVEARMPMSFRHGFSATAQQSQSTDMFFVYASKNKEGFVNLYQNKVVLCLEQVGRFGCFLLMIFNIPHLYDEFWFENGLTVYLICNGVLLALYLLGWFICSKLSVFKATVLSVLPSLIFLFSGITILSYPLLAAAVIFTGCHITVSVKNAYMQKNESKDKTVR